MSVTVAFDPTKNSLQAQVIPDATPKNDGVMTAEQARFLSTLTAAILPFLATTTDGTQTTIGMLGGKGDGAYLFDVSGTASDAGGINAACFQKISFGFIVTGGVITVTSIPLPAQIFGNPTTGVGGAYIIDLVPAGDHVDVKVTGFAGITVNWEVLAED